jgi:hypothetical protein
MLPDFVEPTISASERRVHAVFRDAPGTKDWTILHSLGVSSGWTGQFGEVDFVVVMPRLGILCVEVKGGSVAVRNGVWSTRDRWGSVHALNRSPYRQAQEAMWKIAGAIRERFGKNSSEARCPVGWMVVFPDVQCPPLTPEAAREEIIDRDDLNGDLAARLSSAPSLVRLAARPDLVPPSAGTCSAIVRFLRPEFDRVAASVSEAWDAEARIKALTEEQFDALDMISDNRVALLQGTAGTGKTLIGIENARRASALGRDVLLLCFNQNLGKWLAQTVVHFGPGRVVAGNVHSLLRERILASSFAGDLRALEGSGIGESQLFGESYYELGALAIEEGGERFDEIVFDEVQDFPAGRVGELIAAWRRSTASSRVLLLGDFTRQAIYSGASETSASRLQGVLGNLAVFNIRTNCRNTRRIALQTGVLSGFGEQRVSERQPEGEQVSLQFYADAASALTLLQRIVRSLKDAGQKAGEVVILGPRRRAHSLLRDIRKIGGWPVCELAQARAGELAYSTIHAFKGLERQVVIVIEVEGSTVEESYALFYVAMSRARLRLFILAPESARPILDSRLAAAAHAIAARKE